MKVFCLSLAATTAAATDVFCAIINDALPSICACVDTKTGLKVTCDLKIDYGGTVITKPIIDTTVSFIYALNPCAKVASASLDVRNTDPKIDFPYTIKADEDKQIAVPDLSWTIPGAGGGFPPKSADSMCHAAAHAAVTAIAAHHCC